MKYLSFLVESLVIKTVNLQRQAKVVFTTVCHSRVDLPSELTRLAFHRNQSRFAVPFDESAKQDGYPPHFFKRLDKYIKDNGFRARDVFLALDHDNDKTVTVDEIVSGLNRIEFKVRSSIPSIYHLLLQ